MYSDSVHQLPDDNLPAARRRGRVLRGPGSRIWAWIIMVLLLAGALWAVYQFFVVSLRGQIVDHAALASAELRLRSLHEACVSLLADLRIVVASIAAVGFFVLTLWRRRWLASLIVALTFAAATFPTQELKVLLERPELANGVPYYTGNSRPSGHRNISPATPRAV